MRRRTGGWVVVLAFSLLAVAADAPAMPSSDTGVVRFVYPDASAERVFVAGDFNGWSQTATPLDREEAGWVTRVFLDPGVYEYKFFVDGQWKLDADNPERSLQGNSVVRVGADGEVLPPRATLPGAGGADSTGAVIAARDFVGSIRYLGFVTARKNPALDRWDLERPIHDVDLRLDARIAPELSAFALANLTNAADSVAAPTAGGTEFTLRYDRGQIEWAPGSSTLRLFDNVEVANFDDPAALVGRIGIYADPFGYLRRGADWRQRVLGARLEIVYADDTESAVPRPSEIVPPTTSASELYVASTSQRGSDAFALRVKGGTDKFGFGVVARSDRGRYAGRLVRTTSALPSPDSLVVSGEAFDTTERSESWGIDLRGRWRDLRIAAEVLDGRSRAQASSVVDVTRTVTPDSTYESVGVARADGSEFALDGSRRAILALGWARFDAQRQGDDPWSARPGTGLRQLPSLVYSYEEHDFTALGVQAAPLAGGAPFLQRHHGLLASFPQRFASVETELEIEQHWFTYPDPLAWETQFWFRQRNFWLDEDVASLERLTLLGARTASIARLHAASPLWARIALRGELHVTYAAPGFEHAPRYTEGILRLALPLGGPFELRTHSRLAVYRQFETQDPAVVAALGPGKHFEAGLPAGFAVDASHSYRALSAHFVEVVAAITSRSDIALGFGVDPFVVYEITNEYAPIGWDSFVFASGASPQDAFANPIDLGRRLEDAERALEKERRVTLEARLRF